MKLIGRSFVLGAIFASTAIPGRNQRANPALIFPADRPGLNMDKKSLSESDICSKFITPALVQTGWDEASQIRREELFNNGRILVRGKIVSRVDRLVAKNVESREVASRRLNAVVAEFSGKAAA